MEVDFEGLAQDFILVAIDFMGEIEDKMKSPPTRISRLISRPTEKKKRAIKASSIQWTRHLEMLNCPNERDKGVCQKE